MQSSATLSAESIDVPDQQQHFNERFPIVLRCRTPQVELAAVCHWLRRERDRLAEQVQEVGAILFRDFPLSTAEDFDAFVRSFDWPNFPYDESLSNAVRINKTERVFTANEAPASVKILLHHEMAQTPFYPTKLFFFCVKAAEEGGATSLCRSDVLAERLTQERPEFLDACAEKGLKYSNVMPPQPDASSGMGRSWRDTLGAGNEAQAEQRLTDLGYSWEWLPDSCLRVTTPVLPAVISLPNGRRSFFNQLIAAFRGWKDERNDPTQAITFGDGSRLSTDDVLLAADLAEQLTFDLKWQAGDVALVDNIVAMHGRRQFQGTRQVLASLVKEPNIHPKP